MVRLQEFQPESKMAINKEIDLGYSSTREKLVTTNKNDVQPVFDHLKRWTASGISWALAVSLLTLYRWKCLMDIYTTASSPVWRLKCGARWTFSTKTTTNPFHSIRHLWHLHRFRRLFHTHYCVCAQLPDFPSRYFALFAVTYIFIRCFWSVYYSKITIIIIYVYCQIGKQKKKETKKIQLKIIKCDKQIMKLQATPAAKLMLTE